MRIRLVFKRIFAGGMALVLIAAMLPVGALELAYATGENDGESSAEGVSGVISYNESRVACLAQIDFEAKRVEGGGVQVIVPLDDWSKAAADTSRPYVAFADSGTRHDFADPRLGTVFITGDVRTYVIKLEFANILESEVVFIGRDIGVSDLQDVYDADGSVGGEVDADAAAQALSEAVLDSDDDVESAVVEMPQMTEKAVSAWASSIKGELELCVYRAAGGEDEEEPGGVETVAFDSAKYKGFYPDAHPLAGGDEESGAEALDSLGLADAWLVDGDGYLWCLGADGSLCFYGSPFDAVAENAANEEAITELSDSGEAMAQAMAPKLGSLHADPRIAVKFNGFAVTVYLDFTIDDAALSFDDLTLSFTCAEHLKVSASYALGRDVETVKNKCMNPNAPVFFQAGPLNIASYFSLGVELDVIKFAYSIEYSQLEHVVIDLSTGSVSSEQEESLGRKVSVSGGFSFAAKGFASFDFALGKRIGPFGAGASITSADTGVALEVGVDGNMSSGCSDLSLVGYVYLQATSTYDKKFTDVATTEGDPNIRSMLQQALDGRRVYIEPFGRAVIASCHLENGIRVNSCTKKGPRTLSSSKVKMILDKDSCTYTGAAVQPTARVYYGDAELIRDTDYSLTYENNVNAGMATVTATGKGVYTGSVHKTFSIEILYPGCEGERVSGTCTTMSIKFTLTDTGSPVSKLRVFYGASEAAVKSGKTFSTFDVSLKKKGDAATVKLNDLAPGKRVYFDCALGVAANGSVSYASRSDNEIGYASTSALPEFSGTVGSRTTSSAKITIKLKTAAATKITKIKVTYGTTKAAAKEGKKKVTKTVSLVKKGASGALTLKNLKAGTRYYFVAHVGLVSGGKTYWRTNSCGYFPTKVKASTADLLGDGYEEACGSFTLPEEQEDVQSAIARQSSCIS